MHSHFTSEKLREFQRRNDSLPRDRIPDLIAVVVFGTAIIMLIAPALLYRQKVTRAKFAQIIASCPTEVLGEKVCSHLEDPIPIDIVTAPHNLVPVCSLNPAFEAQKSWKSNICQLASDRPELPNLATACTAMQRYIQTIEVATQEACR